ncbi:tail fiber domain-containing protein [Nonlabens xiamenensis]|uniref:tail fiber domain-containing protein n=1 Tax=Nonlabens xiamenensis TaxID=2341043 RepID=UPI000F6049DF|nr:tail fiber domain-containing protein [Nonlabens xiamenensis]
MIRNLLLLILLVTGISTQAQVGINTLTPAASLDVVGDPTDLTLADGIIPPRISRADLVAKNAAYTMDQAGTIVFVDDITGTADVATGLINTVGYYFFDGSLWQTLTIDAEKSKWSNNTTDNRVELTNTSAGVARTAANAIVVEDAGNMGIGIEDPTQRLSVGGNINSSGNLELNQLGTGDRASLIDFHSAGLPATVDRHARIIRGAGTDGNLEMSNNGNGDFILNNTGTGNLQFDTGNVVGVSLLVDGSDGFVGINTVDPTQELDVNGNGLFQNNIFVSGVPSAGENGLRIHKDGDQSVYFDMNSNAASVTPGNSAFYFRADNTDGTSRLMNVLYNGTIQNEGGLSTGGNMELGQRATGDRPIFIDFHSSDTGNTDFKSRLLRNPGENSNFAILNRGSGNINIDVLGVARNSISINGSNGFVAINKTTAPTAELDVDGNGIFVGTVTAAGTLLTSDRRLKKNVVEIDDMLEKVMELRPVFYEKKRSIEEDSYDRQEYGFIAQELQKILPEIVTTTTREDQLLGVDYNSLIPILTRAVQQQQAQLEAKNAETEALKEELKSLKNEIENIKKLLKTN